MFKSQSIDSEEEKTGRKMPPREVDITFAPELTTVLCNGECCFKIAHLVSSFNTNLGEKKGDFIFSFFCIF